jgi:hypothetical protein
MNSLRDGMTQMFGSAILGKTFPWFTSNPPGHSLPNFWAISFMARRLSFRYVFGIQIRYHQAVLAMQIGQKFGIMLDFINNSAIRLQKSIITKKEQIKRAGVQDMARETCANIKVDMYMK